MIQNVRFLDAGCVICAARASVEVERSNDELPDTYVQHGTRMLYYCDEHVPEDVREFWSSHIKNG